MPPLAAGVRRREPGLPRHLGDPRPRQQRPGHGATSAGRSSAAPSSSRSSRRCRCGASAGRCEPRRRPAPLGLRRAAPGPGGRRTPRGRRPAGRERRRPRAPQRLPGHHRVTTGCSRTAGPGRAAGRRLLGARIAGREQHRRAQSGQGHPGDGVVDRAARSAMLEPRPTPAPRSPARPRRRGWSSVGVAHGRAPRGRWPARSASTARGPWARAPGSASPASPGDRVVERRERLVASPRASSDLGRGPAQHHRGAPDDVGRGAPADLVAGCRSASSRSPRRGSRPARGPPRMLARRRRRAAAPAAGTRQGVRARRPRRGRRVAAPASPPACAAVATSQGVVVARRPARAPGRRTSPHPRSSPSFSARIAAHCQRRQRGAPGRGRRSAASTAAIAVRRAPRPRRTSRARPGSTACRAPRAAERGRQRRVDAVGPHEAEVDQQRVTAPRAVTCSSSGRRLPVEEHRSARSAIARNRG